MEQHWWSSDWLKYLVGWVVGIPSGIVANWLYDKIKTWRRKETDYINTSYSRGIMRFEGQYTSNVPIKNLINQILKPPSDNSLTQEQASQDDQSETSGQRNTSGNTGAGL
jgi:hypothetical protein